jgi:hypothetical protein
MYSLLPPSSFSSRSRLSTGARLVLVSSRSRLSFSSLGHVTHWYLRLAAGARLELCVAKVQVSFSRARGLDSLGCLSDSHPPFISFSAASSLATLRAKIALVRSTRPASAWICPAVATLHSSCCTQRSLGPPHPAGPFPPGHDSDPLQVEC